VLVDLCVETLRIAILQGFLLGLIFLFL